MILDTLSNADRYASLHPAFAEAFAFLRNADLKSISQGRHALDGERLFAIVSRSPGRTREDAKLECHRRYVDIQYVIDGVDEMGWRATGECIMPTTEYSEEKDIRFFADTPEAWVPTRAGSFCIFFPEDAHAPLVGTAPIHKVVIKISVD